MPDNKNGLRFIGKGAVWGLSLLGIGVLWCLIFGFCWWCPPAEDCTIDSKATITVEDAHAGVWMVTDNSGFEFGEHEHDGVAHDHLAPEQICDSDDESNWGRCKDNYDTLFRHGVLFQMGHTYYTDTTKDPPEETTKTAFHGVYLVHDDDGDGVDTPVYLIPGTGDPWDWLDVRASGSSCVIDPLTAYSMFHNATTVTTECDPLPTSDPDRSCSRNRSIHASVQAQYLITYWAGTESFYQMTTGPTDEMTTTTTSPTHVGSHVSYKFYLPDVTQVDRWFEGCYRGTWNNVKEIRILHHVGSSYHLGFPHIPMDGGTRDGG